MKTALCLTVCAVICSAAPRTELGEINGARFRIDIPEQWNGGLVIYCHGYSPKPVTYEQQKLAPLLAVFTDQGYAVAQSGYAKGGWAIQEAVVDTENLRRYFIHKYGPVKETFITGHSMGGFLTMMLMESSPTVYDAGLPLCGPLAAPNYFMARAFDSRVVFDYYFPNLLPNPSKSGSDLQSDKETQSKILEALDSAPDKAAVLRRLNGANIKNNKDLAGVISFISSMLRELQQRAGGNPFDNRNTIYSGTPDDNALNAGVKRYAADPKAASYLREYYTPTGRIEKPMLAVHTSYDPLVPAWIPTVYQSLVEQSGAAPLFVQQYVPHDGHCAILPNEVARAFSELREWKSSGVRPAGGELVIPVAQQARTGAQ
ncbi:MAG TPA: alpha/beta fold hydrolase [Bryobacteraceae bacterium]|nr:alpha/beta fold hydrolase [Bryobacteraceae bacterium]